MSGFCLLVYCAGDIESMPFIEALGQFSYKVGKLCSLRCSSCFFFEAVDYRLHHCFCLYVVSYRTW